jgi:UMF1 family MFS transporter
MSIYIGKVFKVSQAELTNIILFSTIFALIASLVSGAVSDRFGYKRSLVGVFILWGITLLLGGILEPPFQWLIGALAAVSLGSTWVISRALIINLVPKEKVGEVFGLFNFVAYTSAIVGPLVWGLIIWAFSSFEELGYRLACLSSIIFITIGVIFLLRLKGPKLVI